MLWCCAGDFRCRQHGYRFEFPVHGVDLCAVIQINTDVSNMTTMCNMRLLFRKASEGGRLQIAASKGCFSEHTHTSGRFDTIGRYMVSASLFETNSKLSHENVREVSH